MDTDKGGSASAFHGVNSIESVDSLDKKPAKTKAMEGRIHGFYRYCGHSNSVGFLGYCVISIILTLQQVAFVSNIYIPNNWESDTADVITYIAKAVIQMPFHGNVAQIIAAACVVGFYQLLIIGAYITAYLADWTICFRILHGILPYTNVLFLPISEVLLRMVLPCLSYREASQTPNPLFSEFVCWSPEHIGYSIQSLVVFGFTFLLVLCTIICFANTDIPSNLQVSMHNLCSVTTTRIEIRFMFVKTALLVLYISGHSSQWRIAMSCIAFLSGLGLCFSYVKCMPQWSDSALSVQIFQTLTLVFIGFILFVKFIHDDINSSVTLLFASVPIAAIMSVAIVRWRQYKLSQLNITDMSSPEQCACLIRYHITSFYKYISSMGDIYVESNEHIDARFEVMNENVKALFVIGNNRFPNNPHLSFIVTTYYNSVSMDRVSAYQALNLFRKCDLSFAYRYYFHTLQVILHAASFSDQDADMKAYVEVSTKTDLLYRHLHAVSTGLLQFWTMLIQGGHINMNQMTEIGMSTRTNIRKCTDLFTRLMILHPNDPKMMELYGYFLLDILGDTIRSAQFFSAASNVRKLKQTTYTNVNYSQFRSDIPVYLSIFDDENGVVSITYDADRIGIVDRANHSFMKMFYRYDIIGRNISSCIPSPISDNHDDLLRNYFNLRKSHIIGHTLLSLGLHRTGFQFPMSLNIRWKDQAAGSLLALVNKLSISHEICVIIEDKTFKVLHSTENLSSILGYSSKDILASTITLFDIFPSLVTGDKDYSHLNDEMLRTLMKKHGHRTILKHIISGFEISTVCTLIPQNVLGNVYYLLRIQTLSISEEPAMVIPETVSERDLHFHDAILDSDILPSVALDAEEEDMSVKINTMTLVMDSPEPEVYTDEGFALYSSSPVPNVHSSLSDLKSSGVQAISRHASGPSVSGHASGRVSGRVSGRASGLASGRASGRNKSLRSSSRIDREQTSASSILEEMSKFDPNATKKATQDRQRRMESHQARLKKAISLRGRSTVRILRSFKYVSIGLFLLTILLMLGQFIYLEVAFEHLNELQGVTYRLTTKQGHGIISGFYLLLYNLMNAFSATADQNSLVYMFRLEHLMPQMNFHTMIDDYQKRCLRYLLAMRNVGANDEDVISSSSRAFLRANSFLVYTRGYDDKNVPFVSTQMPFRGLLDYLVSGGPLNVYMMYSTANDIGYSIVVSNLLSDRFLNTVSTYAERLESDFNDAVNFLLPCVAIFFGITYFFILFISGVFLIPYVVEVEKSRLSVLDVFLTIPMKIRKKLRKRVMNIHYIITNEILSIANQDDIREEHDEEEEEEDDEKKDQSENDDDKHTQKSTTRTASGWGGSMVSDTANSMDEAAKLVLAEDRSTWRVLRSRTVLHVIWRLLFFFLLVGGYFCGALGYTSIFTPEASDRLHQLSHLASRNPTLARGLLFSMSNAFISRNFLLNAGNANAYPSPFLVITEDFHALAARLLRSVRKTNSAILYGSEDTPRIRQSTEHEKLLLMDGCPDEKYIELLRHALHEETNSLDYLLKDCRRSFEGMTTLGVVASQYVLEENMQMFAAQDYEEILLGQVLGFPPTFPMDVVMSIFSTIRTSYQFYTQYMFPMQELSNYLFHVDFHSFIGDYIQINITFTAVMVVVTLLSYIVFIRPAYIYLAFITSETNSVMLLLPLQISQLPRIQKFIKDSQDSHAQQ